MESTQLIKQFAQRLEVEWFSFTKNMMERLTEIAGINKITSEILQKRRLHLLLNLFTLLKAYGDLVIITSKKSSSFRKKTGSDKMDRARIFVQVGDAWRDIDTQELSEKGTVRPAWKCHLCSFNDGNTGPMFKLVNAHKFKLCCRDCARMPGMIDIIFDSDMAFKLHQYLQDH